jgi:hypothetical protein
LTNSVIAIRPRGLRPSFRKVTGASIRSLATPPPLGGVVSAITRALCELDTDPSVAESIVSVITPIADKRDRSGMLFPLSDIACAMLIKGVVSWCWAHGWTAVQCHSSTKVEPGCGDSQLSRDRVAATIAAIAKARDDNPELHSVPTGALIDIDLADPVFLPGEGDDQEVTVCINSRPVPKSTAVSFSDFAADIVRLARSGVQVHETLNIDVGAATLPAGSSA